VIDAPELRRIGVFFGGVRADNVGSIRCFERAGFIRRSDRPDFEGMLHLAFVRDLEPNRERT
jgi:RimJ/RimL family protein N-acetyltransferase